MDTNLAELNAIYIFALPLRKWRHSSAGSEHLPYKQRVGGSNPSTPTGKTSQRCGVFYFTASSNLAISNLVICMNA